MNLAIVLFASFFGLCILGVPVAVSLGVSALLTGTLAGMPPVVMVQQMFAMLDSFTLVAIPLFLLVGIIMEHGEITDRFVAFSRSLVGHIRGGLGHVNIFANMLMAGISGSANADAAALGGIMIPAMKQDGYSGEMAAAINACASTMGPIIPPSLLMIVYGAYGGLSIAALFLAGALPGVFVAGSMMITLYFWAKKNDVRSRDKIASMHEIWDAFRRALFALVTPLIIFAGVLSGKFTATESGMVAAVYSLLITITLYRTIKLGTIIKIIKQGLITMSAPMLCSAGAGAFGYMMAYLEIPQAVVGLSGFVHGNYYYTLIFITGLFIILGCFMDAIPAIMIFLPIVQSLSNAAGLDPLHVGILVVVVLCFGFITPPYGLTLLLSASIAEVESTKVVRAAIPFYWAFLIICIIMIFFPSVILFLPRTILGI